MATPKKPESAPVPAKAPTVIPKSVEAAVEDLHAAVAHAESEASKPVVAEPEELVRVYHNNKTQGSLIHGEHKLIPGGFADVPDRIAKIWLAMKFYGQPVAVQNGPAPAAAPLKKELDAEKLKTADLETRLANLEKALAEERAKNPKQ